jgi:hypothetical protein
MRRPRIFSGDDAAGLMDEFEPGAGGAMFCDNWEDAKRALEALADAARRPLVRTTIRTVIELGDVAYERRCGD